MPCSPKVAAYLKTKLSPTDWQRVEPLIQRFQLFEYYETDGRVELEEELDLDDALEDQHILDLLLECCQLLNDQAPPEVKQECSKLPDLEGEHTFYFTFSRNKESATNKGIEVASALVELLEKNSGFRYRVQELPGETRVEVTIFFRSELEYQRKKEAINWLVQVAQGKVSARPFKGHRLS